VSSTLREPLEWKNSTVVADLDAVASIKAEPGGDLIVLGSGELARSLAGRGLVDEYVLLVHPLVLGSGQRLFEPGPSMATLELTDSRASTTGVIIATYRVRSSDGDDGR
jgi:dihydrofolate reductase